MSKQRYTPEFKDEAVRGASVCLLTRLDRLGLHAAIEQWQEPRCESGDSVNAPRILVRKHMQPIPADTFYHPCNDI